MIIPVNIDIHLETVKQATSNSLVLAISRLCFGFHCGRADG